MDVMRTLGPRALLGLGASTLVATALVASCAHPTAPTASPTARPPHAPTVSNVLRSDYVGSAECAGCHAKETEGWARSPMHHMTRNADAPDVKTGFDGRAMHFNGDTVWPE